VQQDFLSEEERRKLLAIYAGIPDDSVTNPTGNGGNKVGYRSMWTQGMSITDQMPSVVEKVVKLLEEMGRETHINITDPKLEEMFFTTNASDRAGSLMFGWHQDVENFFYWQDLHNYADFYIFLDKPLRNEAGVSLVPWDAMRAKSPELYELTWATRTAMVFSPTPDGTTYAIDMMTDRPRRLGFHLDQVACAPDVGPGDLLVFGGDVVHKTQEHNSHRISLNLNAHTQASVAGYVTVAELLRGAGTKYNWMARNPNSYLGVHMNSQLSALARNPPPMVSIQTLGVALDISLRVAFVAGDAYHQALGPVRMGLHRFFR